MTNREFKSWAIVYDFKQKCGKWVTVPSIWARFTTEGYKELEKRLPSLIMRETGVVKNYRIAPSEFDMDQLELNWQERNTV